MSLQKVHQLIFEWTLSSIYSLIVYYYIINYLCCQSHQNIKRLTIKGIFVGGIVTRLQRENVKRFTVCQVRKIFINRLQRQQIRTIWLHLGQYQLIHLIWVIFFKSVNFFQKRMTWKYNIFVVLKVNFFRVGQLIWKSFFLLSIFEFLRKIVFSLH